MEKVEVDLKLFVTCRLCLEDKGIYQIIPNIQHQIKYSYGIDVAPFDGLPQLICKKCESKLTEYFTVKTAYVAKQQLLINSVQNKNVKSDVLHKIAASATFQSQAVSAEKQADTVPVENVDSRTTNEWEEEKPRTSKSSAKTKRIDSTSSAPSERDNSDGAKVKPLIIKKKKYDNKRQWNYNDYNIYFSCRICNKSYVKRNFLLKHYSNIHSEQFKKYKSILNSLCSVRMEKFDKKPNFTGVNNTVVLSKEKVITHERNSKYYILYTLKGKNVISNGIQAKSDINGLSDSSDDAEYSVSRKKTKKRRRLLSSDTVVIEKKDDNEKSTSSDDEDHLNSRSHKSKKDEVITECINLDSESEAETISANNVTDNFFYEENENKLIRNVIDVCHGKYIRHMTLEKNKRPNYANIESQLMHKVLNLGRKIINRQGLNCTGLLRFLEYRNLEVIWSPKTCHSLSGPPLRISMTTLRSDHQKPEDNDLGWTDVPVTHNILSDEKSISSNEPIRDLGNILQFSNDRDDIVSRKNNSNDNGTHLGTYNIKASHDTLGIISHDQTASRHTLSDQACLYKYEDTSSSGKLLNKNPVANPKQLPKKVINYEIKSNKSVSDSDLTKQLLTEMKDNESLLFTDLNNAEADNDLTGMPIITSTTSLALDYNQFANEGLGSSIFLNDEATNLNKKPSSSIPRIKVKPVSELMPENASIPNSLLLNQNNINNFEERLPNMVNIIPHMAYQNSQNVAIIPTPDPVVNNTLPEQKNNSESIILHTVELPNTKTDSPFKYVKTLLGIHNIHLLGIPNIHLLEYMGKNEFHCLIKFKVLFKQEAVKPIILCLSLHCNTNRFYIGIKDSNDIEIDMQKISANWQWEIIKIFQGDVGNKIHQSAFRMGPEVHNNTTKFIFLIKCIQMKKID